MNHKELTFQINRNKMENMAYKKLVWVLAVSLFIMYGVMFLNIDSTDHIYLSLTRLYMALLMVSPMALLMIYMMPAMYVNKKLNTMIGCISVTVFVLALTFLRLQIFINDAEYMKAMIPHHSSAILTSKNANIQNPEVKKLSKGIIESQEKEIREMKSYLEKY
jgi:hypothetical protein